MDHIATSPVIEEVISPGVAAEGLEAPIDPEQAFLDLFHSFLHPLLGEESSLSTTGNIYYGVSGLKAAATIKSVAPLLKRTLNRELPTQAIKTARAMGALSSLQATEHMYQELILNPEGYNQLIRRIANNPIKTFQIFLDKQNRHHLNDLMTTLTVFSRSSAHIVMKKHPRETRLLIIALANFEYAFRHFQPANALSDPSSQVLLEAAQRLSEVSENEMVINSAQYSEEMISYAVGTLARNIGSYLAEYDAICDTLSASHHQPSQHQRQVAAAAATELSRSIGDLSTLFGLNLNIPSPTVETALLRASQISDALLVGSAAKQAYLDDHKAAEKMGSSAPVYRPLETREEISARLAQTKSRPLLMNSIERKSEAQLPSGAQIAVRPRAARK